MGRRPRKPTDDNQNYNGGHIRREPSGAWLAEVNSSYTRHRRVHKTIQQARAYIDQTQIDIANERRPLTSEQVRDAQRAFDRLPRGVSLSDAADQYLRDHAPGDGKKLSEAIETFLREKAAAGLRPRSLDQLQRQIRALIEEHGDEPVGAIRADQLIEWLDARELTGYTRDGYRRAWSNFFGWCRRAGIINHNPAEGITPVRVDDRLPGILTVPQSRALLKAAAPGPASIPGRWPLRRRPSS